MRPTRNNPGRSRTARALRAAAGRAFTLIEVLIAVGAVALIGVAIAAVFDHTGRTVTAGRRLSTMTAYAALIEQRMRADFDRITRDGFLIIHNQLADANVTQGFDYNYGPGAVNTPGPQDVVALHPEDLDPRPRRIDEFMFFIKGDFTTAREPLHPDAVARADAARVYYGHGKRRIENTALGTSPYMLPRVNDLNDESNANLGYVPANPAVVNPNRYASDWTLLRQQTILAPARSTPVTLTPQPFLLVPAQTQDVDEQIALQPAASNLFRALAAQFPANGQIPGLQPFAQPIRGSAATGDRPLFSSGIVDIASTTLPEVRLVVLTADPFPGPGLQLTFFDPSATSNGGQDGSNHGIDGKWRIYADDATVIDHMQSWMEDALPAWSHNPIPTGRTRVRCEPVPPNYLGILSGTPPYSSDLQREYRRGDQVMLSASSFVPRCTEFIVEWSFGKVFPSDPSDPQYVAGHAGETIWHGMERLPDGTPVQAHPDAVAYPYDDTDVVARVERRFRRLDGSVRHDGYPNASDPNRWVQSFLIHNHDDVTVAAGAPWAWPVQAGDPLMSYFGYVDPTFDPNKGGTAGVLDDPTDSASPTIPWPWPKLIRVTLGLADPADPTVEQRFQFVFELPPSPEP